MSTRPIPRFSHHWQNSRPPKTGCGDTRRKSGSMNDVVTLEMARRYHRLFVNRRAYTLQSQTPNPNGRHYYYRPRSQASLSLPTLVHHLKGDRTLGLYAINPQTQKAKWAAIDADYGESIPHLLQMQWAFSQDGMSSALEPSRRGGHLWIFGEEPLPARLWRLYVLATAKRLHVPVKGGMATTGLSSAFAVTRTGRLLDGIEVFPKQDSLNEGEFGNGLRGPLGMHRANGRRYWFGAAAKTVAAQLAYLDELPKVSEATISRLTEGMSLPEEFVPISRIPAQPVSINGRGFRILDHVKVRYRMSGNYWGRCPSCADAGRDKSGDNLAILIRDPRFYKCWAGCPREMIREVLGHPIREWKAS